MIQSKALGLFNPAPQLPTIRSGLGEYTIPALYKLCCRPHSNYFSCADIFRKVEDLGFSGIKTTNVDWCCPMTGDHVQLQVLPGWHT